ncbi:phage tail tape measure protein [Mesorhizobium xinjiangense]|uniref:phage tail tape measure protein n=1 Tax=Mesorhizobium xinjiangense TaxID=2678685 RepID=UPI0012EE07BF|nr:phage tail tape measure protein [Mesorhizobium xinjiangense]
MTETNFLDDNAYLENTRVELEDLERLSRRFGTKLTSAMRSAAVSGRALDDVLRQIGTNLAGLALEQGLQPLKELSGSWFASLFSAARNVLPFADGGVVSSPTCFPLGGQTGLMGEAGAEAILPLARGADGRLGVAASGSTAPVSIVFNVTSPDAASFRKSEAQLTGMIARAASRGLRSM